MGRLLEYGCLARYVAGSWCEALRGRTKAAPKEVGTEYSPMSDAVSLGTPFKAWPVTKPVAPAGTEVILASS